VTDAVARPKPHGSARNIPECGIEETVKHANPPTAEAYYASHRDAIAGLFPMAPECVARAISFDVFIRSTMASGGSRVVE